MELYQKGFGEHAKRLWQHYGHITQCGDCGSDLKVVGTDTAKVFDGEGKVAYKTAYISKECVSCPSLAREIYPLKV